PPARVRRDDEILEAQVVARAEGGTEGEPVERDPLDAAADRGDERLDLPPVEDHREELPPLRGGGRHEPLPVRQLALDLEDALPVRTTGSPDADSRGARHVAPTGAQFTSSTRCGRSRRVRAASGPS